jgi:hypothetical protein
MPNGEPLSPIYTARPQFIADRIGPIFDPAFLKLIPREKLRDIAVIQLKAQQVVMRAEMDAVEKITKEVEGVKF